MHLEDGHVAPDARPGLDPWALLDAVPDPVVVVASDATLRWANVAAAATFGWDPESYIGEDATAFIHPDDVDTAVMALDSVQDKPTGTLLEIRVRDRSGTYRRVELRGGSAVGLDGIDGVVLVVRDVTDRRRWELAAGDHDALGAVLDALPTIAFVLTSDGRIRSVNRAFTRLLGHPLEGSLGRPLTDFVTIASTLVVSDQLVMVADGPGRVSFEVEMLSVDGTTRPMSLTLVDMADDGVVGGLVATATDISELVAARERLRHAATHDELTGLPNRWLLTDRVRKLVADPMRMGRAGLVFVDIDRVTAINERHGHAVGDEVLKEVAARLVDAVGDADSVGRFGSDEFIVLATAADDQGIDRIVDRVHWKMRTAVRVPVMDSDHDIEIRVSLTSGWVVAGLDDSAEDLVAQADAAMYRAKLRRRARR